MPFGSILANFDEIILETADNHQFRLKNGFLSKIALKIIGIPHIELRIRARRIFSFLPEKGINKKILDAGCGPGIYSLAFSQKGFEVYSVDIDKDKLEFLRKNSNNLKIFEGDLTQLKFNDEFFDYVVCSDVIEHIKDDEKAVKELSRVLKSGGTLILTVPAYSKKNMKDYKRFGHERIGYKIEDIKRLAQKNNLKIISIKTHSGPLVEKIFSINEKLYSNKGLLGILFYPLYLFSFLEDIVGMNKQSFNGLSAKMIKN